MVDYELSSCGPAQQNHRSPGSPSPGSLKRVKASEECVSVGSRRRTLRRLSLRSLIARIRPAIRPILAVFGSAAVVVAAAGLSVVRWGTDRL